MGSNISKPSSQTLKRRLFRGKRPKSDSNTIGLNGSKNGEDMLDGSFNIHDPGPPEVKGHDLSLDRDDVIATHIRLVEKLAATWPSYQFMNELNLNELDTEAIERMNTVFQHLLNQNAAIRGLTVAGRRSGMDANKKRAQFKRASSYEALDDDGPDHVTDHVAARAQLMAEVNKMREEAQKSTISRYSKDGGSVDYSANSLKRQEKMDEMREKIRLLEDNLETKNKMIEELERKQKHRDSKHHHHHHGDHDHEHRKGAHGAEVRQSLAEKIREEHQRLEHVMLNEIKPDLDKLVKFTDDKTKFTYLCTIIMELYTISLKFREDFDEKLENLLLHPTRAEDKPEEKKKRKLISLLKLPSTEERPRTTSKSYVDTQEIPKALKREAIKFVAATSPYSDTKSLVQEVMARMSANNDKITAKLQDNERFHKFVADCAKLTWQLRVLDPPMRLAADLDLLSSDDLHVPYRSIKVKDAPLEYYLWPVLMEGDGTVACKGRVAYKTNQLVSPETGDVWHP